MKQNTKSASVGSFMNSYPTLIKYEFGVKVPKNHQQAMEFDKENKNDFWAQAVKT